MESVRRSRSNNEELKRLRRERDDLKNMLEKMERQMNEVRCIIHLCRINIQISCIVVVFVTLCRSS